VPRLTLRSPRESHAGERCSLCRRDETMTTEDDTGWALRKMLA
jgi:hypothetical protein